MYINEIKSEKEMIKALQNIGIEIKPILKAFIPQNMGTPMRVDEIIEEMNIDEAYRKFCLSPMCSYDPFSKTNK